MKVIVYKHTNKSMSFQPVVHFITYKITKYVDFCTTKDSTLKTKIFDSYQPIRYMYLLLIVFYQLALLSAEGNNYLVLPDDNCLLICYRLLIAYLYILTT